MTGRKIKIIEAASEIGAGEPGASLGPKAILTQANLKHSGIFNNLEWAMVPNANHRVNSVNATPDAKHIESLFPVLKAVSEMVEDTLTENCFPLIFSGDHSNAIGSVAGIKNHLGDKKIGILWIDAHLDLHSPYTTPSGNMHGMALNASLDMDNAENGKRHPDGFTLETWDKLKHLGNKNICPKVQPENLVFIGIRSYEDEEMAILGKNNIKVFRPDEVEEEGMEQILKESLDYLKDCDCLYVSFDVDSMDPSISKGTGTPVPGGLSFEDAQQVFKTLFHHPKVIAFEITEINPLLDNEKPMAAVVLRLLEGVLG